MVFLEYHVVDSHVLYTVACGYAEVHCVLCVFVVTKLEAKYSPETQFAAWANCTT